MSELEMKLENIIRDTLREIGMPNTLAGYGYCVKAVVITFEDPTILHFITSGMYVKVAKECNSTPSRVEHAMRYAIKASWNRLGSDIRSNYFNSTSKSCKDTPIVSEFIGCVYEIVRLKLLRC